MKNYLNFETDIKKLEEELDQLKDPYNQEGLSEVDTNKISKLQIFQYYTKWAFPGRYIHQQKQI